MDRRLFEDVLLRTATTPDCKPLRNADIMTPAELLLGLVLTGTQSHYEHRGVIDDKRLEHLLLAGKQILYKSHQESDVRCVSDKHGARC